MRSLKRQLMTIIFDRVIAIYDRLNNDDGEWFREWSARRLRKMGRAALYGAYDRLC